MNYNAKNSLLLQLLKLFGAYIVSQLLIVFIFAAAVSGDEIPEKYDLPIIIAILLAFAVNMVIDFNAIARLKSTIAKSKSDIAAVTETGAALIDKAERVADKYRKSETDVYSEFAEARSGKRIRSGNDFKAVMEAYPELKSNEHTQKLLNQIEQTENAKLKARMTYSEAAAKYNAKIHSFPIVILRRAMKWEDEVITAGIPKEDIVSDEELGI